VKSLLVGAVCAALALGAAPAAADLPHARTAACGTPLSDGELDTIADLSDTTTLTGTPLQRLETAADRLHRITEILVTHRDRRGLFPVGLDAVEQSAVLPLQRDPASFTDSGYAHAISLDLLRRFLVNLHGEFTSGPVEPHWARYFALAGRCDISGARVAMAGYNAHLTVDLAYSIATVETRLENAGDYFKIVDAIAQAGFTLVDRTKAAYDADLGPLWRFYFFGEGLDLLAGQGVATGLMLRAADLGYNVIVFGNGLALQDPAAHDATAEEIQALFETADVAFEALAQLHGL
jgi:hypothetical protein